MPRQGSISAAVPPVLSLVLGPAGPAEPRTPKPVKLLPGAACSFCLSPPLLGFLWNNKVRLLDVTNSHKVPLI